LEKHITPLAGVRVSASPG